MLHGNRKLIQYKWLLLWLQILHLYWLLEDKKSNQMNFIIIEMWESFIHSTIFIDHCYVPIMVLSAGDTYVNKADKNTGSQSLKGARGDCHVIIIHVFSTLYISKQFFIHVLILFPTDVFTTRQISLFSVCRYANWCSNLRDERTPQTHPDTNGKAGTLLFILRDLAAGICSVIASVT